MNRKCKAHIPPKAETATTHELGEVKSSITLLLGLFLIAFSLTSCSDSKWGELPSPISSFITEYFPYSSIESYSENDNEYYIRVKDGPSMIFDSSYSWTTIDGEGATLPHILLFDELPPALYEYLESAESLASVYRLDRNSRQYDVGLFDTALTYTIATGEIHSAY